MRKTAFVKVTTWELLMASDSAIRLAPVKEFRLARMLAIAKGKVWGHWLVPTWLETLLAIALQAYMKGGVELVEGNFSAWIMGLGGKNILLRS